MTVRCWPDLFNYPKGGGRQLVGTSEVISFVLQLYTVCANELLTFSFSVFGYTIRVYYTSNLRIEYDDLHGMMMMIFFQ